MANHVAYCLGDSITVSGSPNYPAVLDTLLDARPDESWIVNNKGISGNQTSAMYARLNTDVISHGDCEYLMVLGGINDIFQGVLGGGGHSMAWWVANAKYYLQLIYNDSHAAGIKVVAVEVLPLGPTANWLGTPLRTAASIAAIKELNTWIHNTAVNVDSIVGTYVAVENPTDTFDDSLTDDDVHPNTAGAAVIGNQVFEVTWPPIDAFIELKALAFSSAFKSIENITPWGVEIGLTDFLNPDICPDGDNINFDMVAQGDPPAWNTVNWEVGSGFLFPQFSLKTDYFMEAFDNAVGMDLALIDISDIIMWPYFYEPPDGDNVNFYPKAYTPVDWDEVNWIWPLHCLFTISTTELNNSLDNLDLNTEIYISLNLNDLSIHENNIILSTAQMLSLLSEISDQSEFFSVQKIITDIIPHLTILDIIDEYIDFDDLITVGILFNLKSVKNQYSILQPSNNPYVEINSYSNPSFCIMSKSSAHYDLSSKIDQVFKLSSKTI